MNQTDKLSHTQQANTQQANSHHYKHLSLAEAGKLAVTQSRYEEGLGYIRAALSLAIRMQAPVIFPRHYIDCIVDTLEQSTDYQQALEILEQAIAERQEHEDQVPIHQLDQAQTLLRCAVLLFKLDLKDEAAVALEEAKKMAGNHEIPLLDKLMGWHSRGLKITAQSILDVQKSTDYFLIRRDQLRLDVVSMAPPYSLIRKGII